MTNRRLLSAACATIMLAACGDTPSGVRLAPPAPPLPPPAAAISMLCQARVAERTVTCEPPSPSLGASAVIMGVGNGAKLNTSNVLVTADTFAFDLTVTNQLFVPLGTTDGTTPDPNGVRVFFSGGITTTGGTGNVEVANADGTATFTASDQAYFAYVGIIAPEGTSPARRWKLRMDPGVTAFNFALYVNATYPPGTRGVHMTVGLPANTPVGNSLQVIARVDSASASVAGVNATVSGRTIVLAPWIGNPRELRGTIDLTGIPRGPIQLIVQATAVNGDTGTVVWPLLKDLPPQLVVTAPVNGTVARPGVRVDADCIDDAAACKSIKVTAMVNSSLSDSLAGALSSIHGDVSVARFNSSTVTLIITARDSANQSVSRQFYVPVEGSTRITEVVSAGEVLLDLDSLHVLVADYRRYEQYRNIPWAVRLVDRADSSSLLLASGSSYNSANQSYGWLRGGNALFGGGGALYYRQGTTLDSLGTIRSLVVDGDWARYDVDPGGGRFRNLATGVFATGGGDPAPNGDWAITGCPVRWFHNGSLLTVNGDGCGGSSHQNYAALTDGVNVAYNQTGRLKVYDGTTLFDLGQLPTDDAAFSTGTQRELYDVNNGWTAFLGHDGGGIRQVYVRSPTGEVRRASSSGLSTYLIGVGPSGQAVFRAGNRVYVIRYPYTASAVEVFGDTWRSRMHWRGDDLFVYIGRTAFQVSY